MFHQFITQSHPAIPVCPDLPVYGRSEYCEIEVLLCEKVAAFMLITYIPCSLILILFSALLLSPDVGIPTAHATATV